MKKMQLAVPFILAGALAVAGCASSQSPSAGSEKTATGQPEKALAERLEKTPAEQTSGPNAIKITGWHKLTQGENYASGGPVTREYVTFDHPSNPGYSCMVQVNERSDKHVYYKAETTPVCVPKPAR